MDNIVEIKNLKLRYGRVGVFEELNWSIARGDCWVVAGKSGSGKSSLGKILNRNVEFSGELAINFSDKNPLPKEAHFVDSWYRFSDVEGDSNFYYQQRYNAHASNDTFTVKYELDKFGEARGLNFANATPILEKLGFANCLESRLIELSSGEHKKLQLAMALWFRPQLLILDEPYTGLDKASRKIFNEIIEEISELGATIILITNSTELPSVTKKFAKIENEKLAEKSELIEIEIGETKREKIVPYFLQKAPKVDCQTLVKLENVSVRYGDKVVLNNISWQVNVGEKWALQGANGSGKSTLLSLIDGDHPQAYASGVSLFGKPRGSGESIWDIKEKIGIISPEMHWYFEPNSTVWRAVASGFHDSIGWYSRVGEVEQAKIMSLLNFFDIADVKDRILGTLPLGKQRLALLARTIVKNPQLLILDEPCQGLDTRQTKLFNSILDEISGFGKTIIYVGHYEAQMPNCIDHELVLDKGEIVELRIKNEK